MDKQVEEIIVRTFFNKRVQDRILFELSSKTKRTMAIGRLSHNYLDVLKNQYMTELYKPNSNFNDIAALLREEGAGNICYVISYNYNIDGIYLPLLTALEEAVGFGMPSLISCIPNKLLYLECEQVFGPPPRYILKKD